MWNSPMGRFAVKSGKIKLQNILPQYDSVGNCLDNSNFTITNIAGKTIHFDTEEHGLMLNGGFAVINGLDFASQIKIIDLETLEIVDRINAIVCTKSARFYKSIGDGQIPPPCNLGFEAWSPK